MFGGWWGPGEAKEGGGRARKFVADANLRRAWCGGWKADAVIAMYL